MRIGDGPQAFRVGIQNPFAIRVMAALGARNSLPFNESDNVQQSEGSRLGCFWVGHEFLHLQGLATGSVGGMRASVEGARMNCT